MKLHIEQQKQLQEWNNTQTPFEDNICIHQKLELTAKDFPEKTAISFKNDTITYAKLDELANAIANLLISKGVKIEDFVVLYLDRRIELIASIFGILKAGGVYLPISSEFPNSRISTIFNDAKPKVVITSKELAQNISNEYETILIDDLLNTYNELNITKPEIDVKPSNLAYAIFTSGTSGKPKGVLIEHHSVLNRIGWMQKAYPINQNDVLLQKTPITFDVSIWELFWWSFEGAKLVLLPNGDEKDPQKITSCIAEHQVSVIHFVPSMFNTYVKCLNAVYPQNKIKSIKWLFCSGEELHQSMVSDFYKLNSQLRNNTTVINLYGPTEATVDVTYYTCPQKIDKPIPIGKPIDNTQVYIINENNEILHSETIGELVICGENLSRGYLNRKDLNNEKFINLSVFGDVKRAYKTGDLAFFNTNGEIIYKGRNDFQIKLRGFRIELGEIENVILANKNIAECACILKDRNEETAHIVCFIVSNNESEFNSNKLKDYIREKLPEYMIPSIFCQVKQFPLTQSGKLDRTNLLKELENNAKTEDIYIPANYTNKLISLWSKLLKRPNICPVTNFFDLGGNSLLIVQLSILIKKELDVDIDLITLLQYPTIQQLSDYLSENNLE